MSILGMSALSNSCWVLFIFQVFTIMSFRGLLDRLNVVGNKDLKHFKICETRDFVGLTTFSCLLGGVSLLTIPAPV